MNPLMPYPWPSTIWWKAALSADELLLSCAYYFEKGGHANRYDIGAANGLLRLSIPLVGGRQQRKPLAKIKISYAEDWQRNHWRSLHSAYARTPFFEHYASAIEPLYHKHFERLSDFSIAGIELILKLIKSDISLRVGDDVNLPFYQMPNLEENISYTPEYQQPFKEKNGFLPGLSILDLLFCEGPNTLRYLNAL